MEPKHIIFLSLAAVLISAGIWDVICMVFGSPGDTVSQVIWSLSKEYPFIPLVAGFLLGHLFFPLHVTQPIDKGALP